MSDLLPLAASRLANARHVVVITGAGVSAESGLRTFRGGTASAADGSPAGTRDARTQGSPSGESAGEFPDMAALWKEFDPATLATPEAFQRDPEMVTRWYDWRRLGCLAAEPNPGHLALARLEKELTAPGSVTPRSAAAAPASRTFTLLTQNVDRLHQRAGSVNVVELHGTIMVWRCTRTGREIEPPPTPFDAFPPRSPLAEGGATKLGGPALRAGSSPALLRPSVVWFGEPLPEAALIAAHEAVERCDLFMTIGTSSVVYPAAAFVHAANANGAFTIEVNREATAATRVVDVALAGKSGEILPRLVELAFGTRP